MRQVVLDTETTGLEIRDDHRIIEIGCVELIDRRLTGNNYHVYLQPDREIDTEAQRVHGISSDFLADKPRFSDIVDDLTDYLTGATLVIHNAAFDLGFINHELSRLNQSRQLVEDFASVEDTLLLARKMFPGKRNSLDALCERFSIDNSKRDKHGALLDAELLANVYLAMTGGQTSLSFDSNIEHNGEGDLRTRHLDRPVDLIILKANQDEMQTHKDYLKMLDKASNDKTLWREPQRDESKTATD